jgi:hypothetical protein
MDENIMKVVPVGANEDINGDDIKNLNETLGSVEKKLTKKALFLGGVLRGAGVIVGATGLVLVGGLVLRYIGILPGLSGIAEVIIEAFDKARLGGS